MMACVDHTCCDCGQIFFGNDHFGRCPGCDSFNYVTSFDEPDEPREIVIHDPDALVPAGGMNGRYPEDLR